MAPEVSGLVGGIDSGNRLGGTNCVSKFMGGYRLTMGQQAKECTGRPTHLKDPRHRQTLIPSSIGRFTRSNLQATKDNGSHSGASRDHSRCNSEQRCFSVRMASLATRTARPLTQHRQYFHVSIELEPEKHCKADAI